VISTRGFAYGICCVLTNAPDEMYENEPRVIRFRNDTGTGNIPNGLLIVTDVRRLVVAPVFRLGVRLFLGPSRLARGMPLDVPGRLVPRGLPGVLLRLSSRRSETSLVGGVQFGPVSRSRSSGADDVTYYINTRTPWVEGFAGTLPPVRIYRGKFNKRK